MVRAMLRSMALILPQDISSKATAMDSMPLYSKYFPLCWMWLSGMFNMVADLPANIFPYFAGKFR
jgi:hypothetical protein